MGDRLFFSISILAAVAQGVSWTASAQPTCPQLLADAFDDQVSLIKFLREGRNTQARFSSDLKVGVALGKVEVTLNPKSSNPLTLKLGSPTEMTSKEIVDVVSTPSFKGRAEKVYHEWPPQDVQVRHLFDREGKEHLVVLSPLIKGWMDIDDFTHIVFHDYVVDRSKGQATYVGRAFVEAVSDVPWGSARYTYNITPDFYLGRAGELTLRLDLERPPLPSFRFHTPEGKQAVPGVDSIFRSVSRGSIEVKEPVVRLSFEKGKFSGLGLIQPKDLDARNETWVRPDVIASGRRSSITENVEAELVDLVIKRGQMERPAVAVKLIPKEGYQIQNQDIFEFLKRLDLPLEASSLKFYEAHMREFGVLKNGNLMFFENK